MTDLLGGPTASVEELRREVERLRLLHSITIEFNASLDFDELLPRVFERVLMAVGAGGGSLWITEGDMLHCRLAVGGSAAKLVGARMPVGTGFVGDVAQKQRTTMVMDAVRDPRFQQATDLADAGKEARLRRRGRTSSRSARRSALSRSAACSPRTSRSSLR